MERTEIEREIMDKAKEWVGEYGEDFLVELIDVYLDDAPARMEQLQRAVDGGDAEAISREAHTLKSSSANVGAMTLAAMAQQIELAGRGGGTTDSLAEAVGRMAAAFAQVKATLVALRHGPAEYIGQER